MKTYTIQTQQQGAFTFKGEILGAGTSEAQNHNHASDYVTGVSAQGERRPSCSACRWFEVTLYLTDEDPAIYIVHTIGRSVVPGEIDYGRIVHTESPYTVLEVLTVHQGQNVFIPGPSRLALTKAANQDDGILDAWESRKVI